MCKSCALCIRPFMFTARFNWMQVNFHWMNVILSLTNTHTQYLTFSNWIEKENQQKAQTRCNVKITTICTQYYRLLSFFKTNNGLNIVLGSEWESLSKQAIDFPIPNVHVTFMLWCYFTRLYIYICTLAHSLTHTSKWCVQKSLSMSCFHSVGVYPKKKREKLKKKPLTSYKKIPWIITNKLY